MSDDNTNSTKAEINSSETLNAVLLRLQNRDKNDIDKKVLKDLTILYYDADSTTLNLLVNTLINYPNSVTTFSLICSQSWWDEIFGSPRPVFMETINNLSNLLDPDNNPHGRINHFRLQQSILQPDDARVLFNGIKKNSSLLTKLSLTWNDLMDDSIQIIAEAIGMNQSIQDLHLDLNSIGDTGAHFLAKAISQNRSLRKVDLTRNRIRDDGAVALAYGVMGRQYPASTTTNTSFDRIQIQQQNKRCTFDLDLNYHQDISYLGAKAFASLLRLQHSALVPTVTLTRLSLSNCNIGDDGVEVIAAALRGCFYNDTNRSNNQNNCRFGGLEEFILVFNHISDVGCVHLADALRQNNILSSLDLSYNQIGLEGFSAIRKLLESFNDTLKCIEISDNFFTDNVTEWSKTECEVKLIKALCATYNTETGQQYSDPNLQQQEQEQQKRVDTTEKQKYYQQIKAQKIFEFLYLKLG